MTSATSRTRSGWLFFDDDDQSSICRAVSPWVLTIIWKANGWLLDPADGLQAVQLADLVGQVGGRQPGGQQVVGPGLDLDLAQVAAGDVGSTARRECS